MLTVQAHRGPDGDGQWSDAEYVVLGHRRLAILDPEGGRQPMANDDETVVVTFNGCIYNHVELAAELRTLGHRFHTKCDTEVLLRAYEEWGEACVGRFNGMWAFAVWDQRRRRLFCSRDRLGVKPFYYHWDGDTLTFASEIKALFAAGATTPAADDDGLRQYLTFQFCLNDRTMFKGVRRLEPGTNLIVDHRKAPRITRYWELKFRPDFEHDEAYFVERLRDLIHDSVRLRLRSDVPLGAHLSGGLDSSTIVGAIRKAAPDFAFNTFTGAFSEAGFDETVHARVVAESADTQHHEIYFGPQDFADTIEKIVWHMDEPCAGPGVFPQFCVARHAREHVKVILGGQGGDELFIGYARYLIAYLEETLRGAIEETAGNGPYVATLASIVPSLPTLRTYMPLLKNAWRAGIFEDSSRSYFRMIDRFSDSAELLTGDLADRREVSFDEFDAIFNDCGNAASLVDKILYFDLRTHLQALLQVEDRTSIAWGLESRTPLLDYRLVEFMATVPPVVKFRDGRLKNLFRQAAEPLVPPATMQRKDKMGFPVPLVQWLNGPLRSFAGDVLLSRGCRQRGLLNTRKIDEFLAGAQPFNRGIWGALCLELWHRTAIDSAAATPLRKAA